MQKYFYYFLCSVLFCFIIPESRLSPPAYNLPSLVKICWIYFTYPSGKDPIENI